MQDAPYSFSGCNQYPTKPQSRHTEVVAGWQTVLTERKNKNTPGRCKNDLNKWWMMLVLFWLWVKLFDPLLKDVCVYSLFTLPPNGKDQLLLDFYSKITQSMTVSIRTRREKYYNEIPLFRTAVQDSIKLYNGQLSIAKLPPCLYLYDI